MRKALQVLLGVFGAIAIVIALLHIVLGPSSIPGSVPNNFFIVMTVLELLLPFVYGYLQYRVSAAEPPARGR